MSDLVRKIQLGDITFGIPGDIELLNSPWGFYTFLGIQRNASPEEIKKAYKDLALKLHPDKQGSNEGFAQLERVVEILLDNGGKLGPEHSQRKHYDDVSALDEHFNGFIQYKGERTKKLSEIMLKRMQIERKEAEIEHQLSEKYPRFTMLKEELEKSRSSQRRREIMEEMFDIAAENAGISHEKREELKKLKEERNKQYEAKQGEFVHDFSSSREDYIEMILDIFYVDYRRVFFGQNLGNMSLGFVGHEKRNHVLEMVLAGDCYIAGFSQVHFKAEQAHVRITDPHLTGIFHVVKGGVEVDLEDSSYGSVIRARGPRVKAGEGFIQRGCLFIPESFASQNWWKKKPALDIAVRKGKITLELRSQEIGLMNSYSKFDFDTIISNSDKIKNDNIMGYKINKKF